MDYIVDINTTPNIPKRLPKKENTCFLTHIRLLSNFLIFINYKEIALIQLKIIKNLTIILILLKVLFFQKTANLNNKIMKNSN